jgi:hypothetical protein
MRCLILLLFTACTSQIIKYDYIVETSQGSFLCDELVESPYGIAAKNCEHILQGFIIETIPNPYGYTKVKE